MISTSPALPAPGALRRKPASPDSTGAASVAVVFVASLDPNSDPERKNPEALIDAFRSAFPVADRQVRLVLRLNNAATTLGQAVAQRLLQLAAGDGRIGLSGARKQ